MSHIKDIKVGLATVPYCPTQKVWIGISTFDEGKRKFIPRILPNHNRATIYARKLNTLLGSQEDDLNLQIASQMRKG